LVRTLIAYRESSFVVPTDSDLLMKQRDAPARDDGHLQFLFDLSLYAL
jgi:hypothetical protein